jgi:hypothetical protein
VYLGSYKEINTIEVDTARTTQAGENNSNYGKMLIHYNDTTTVESSTLPLIKSVNYNPSTGKITFFHASDGENDIEIKTDKPISYISNMRIKENNGAIQYKFNNSPENEENS